MWFIIGQVFLAGLVHPGSHLQRASTELTYEMIVLSRILISLTSFHTIPDKMIPLPTQQYHSHFYNIPLPVYFLIPALTLFWDSQKDVFCNPLYTSQLS